jgi:hypothetical protein
MKQDDAQSVNVGSHRRLAAGEQFRGHVGERAAGVRVLGVGMGEAEIDEKNAAAHFAHGVGGFDIAVDQAGGVHGADGAREIDNHARGFARRERPLHGKQRGKGSALDKVAPEADAPAVLFHAMHGDNVGVAHFGQLSRFTENAGRFARRARTRRLQQLEGDFALQGMVEGAVDLAETALADLFDKVKVSPAARRRRIGGRRRVVIAHGTSEIVHMTQP